MAGGEISIMQNQRDSRLMKRISESSLEISEVTDASLLKEIILKRKIRVKLLFTVGIGLPHSGTTSLLMGLLKRSGPSLPQSGQSSRRSGLDIYEAILIYDVVSGKSDLLDVSDEDTSYTVILLNLMKFLTIKRYPIPGPSSLEPGAPFFDHADVDAFFSNFYEKFTDMMRKSKEDEKVLSRLTRSLCFINVLDINVNKAVYELLYIIGSSCKNGILLNVLDLYYYSVENLRKALNLADARYGGKYRGEDQHLFKLHHAVHYFIQFIEAMFALQREKSNAIIVGTGADKFDSQGKLDERKKCVQACIYDCAQGMKIDKAIKPNLIPVRGVEDYEQIRSKLVELIQNDDSFNAYIPMKYMFLRCMLSTVNKLFITRKEFSKYAEACCLESEEVDEFLKIFHNFVSIFHWKDKDHEYIVLKPSQFVRGLDMLYYIKEDPNVSEEVVKQAEYGLISESKMKDLWSEDVEFYVSVLVGIGLMVKITPSDSRAAITYFIPSLRSEYDTQVPTITSDSLLIDYNISLIPFHKQCEFVSQLQNKTKNGFKFVFCELKYYNSVQFECSNNGTVVATVTIRFRSEFLEISVTITESSFSDHIYSIIKKASVEVLNAIRSDIPALHYKMAVKCPECEKGLFKFDVLDTTSLDKRCKKCGVFSSKVTGARLKWVETAYNGSLKSACHPDEYLSIARMDEISKSLSEENFDAIQKIGKMINILPERNEKFPVMEETVFSMLYKWRERNSNVATVHKLAQILLKCDLPEQAYELDPSLY